MYAHIFKKGTHEGAVLSWIHRLRNWKNIHGALPDNPKDIVQMSPEDKRIIDLKPEKRPLTDPGNVLQISKILPNSTYCSYSKVPFFDKMNQLIGVDPLKSDPVEYAKARTEFFNKQPESLIQLDKLVVTQKVVNKAKIEKNIAKGNFGKDAGDIFAVKYQGKFYIMDGHHRVMAAALSGKKKALAHVEQRVLDLDTTTKFDQTIYQWIEGKAAQAYGYIFKSDLTK